MNKSVTVSALLGLRRKTQQLPVNHHGEEKALLCSKDRMSSDSIEGGPHADLGTQGSFPRNCHF